jgi:hypothetical protein
MSLQFVQDHFDARQWEAQLFSEQLWRQRLASPRQFYDGEIAYAVMIFRHEIQRGSIAGSGSGDLPLPDWPRDRQYMAIQAKQQTSFHGIQPSFTGFEPYS